MYDVKSINNITDTVYTRECYLCDLRNNDLKDIDKTLNTPIRASNLKYGISSLHAWIRCFEYLLNIAYRLSICKSIAQKVDKQLLENHKKYIQNQFKVKMNLIVDQPKQGAGNSNDGNTARAFFSNEQKSSEVTGLDVEIIKRFHVILQTLSSGHIIDHHKYKEYAVETARMLNRKYDWYTMTPTVHKVLACMVLG